MKKILTLLMLLALAVPTWAGEQTITISRNDVDWESANTVYNITKGGVQLKMSGGMNNPNFLLMKQQTTMTITSATFNIKKIIFHCLDNTDVHAGDETFYNGPQTMNVQYSLTHGEYAGIYKAPYNGNTYDGWWRAQIPNGTYTDSDGKVHKSYSDGLPAGYELMFENGPRPIRFASIDIVIEKETGDIYELVTKNEQVAEGVNYMLVGRADATTSTGHAMSIEASSSNSAGYQGIKSTEVELIDNGFRVRANDDVQFIHLSQSTFTTPGNEYFPWYLNINSTQSIKTGSTERTGTDYNNGFGLEYQNTPTTTSSARYYHSASISINNENSETNFDHDAVIKFYNQINYYVSGLDKYADCQIKHNNDINLFRNLSSNNSTRQKVFLYKPATQYKVTTDVLPNDDYGAISLRDGVIVDNYGVSWSQQLETVQFLVTPAEGKKIESVTIAYDDDETTTIDPLTVSPSINGTLYTFEMPGHNVHITVTFADVVYHNVNIVIEPDGRCGNVFLTEGYVVQNDQVKSYEGQDVVFNVISNLININNESEGYYELKSVTVTDDITGESITYNLSDGNYSFTMPDHPVTITATFIQAAPTSLYLLGTANGGYWTYEDNGTQWRTYGPVFNYNTNIGYYLDVYFKGTGEYDSEGNTDNAYGYFSISKRYADNQDWNYLNGYRFVARSSDWEKEDISDGVTKTLYNDADNNRGSSFRIPAGIYRIVVNNDMNQVTVTKKDLSLNFDPEGGETADQAQTVSKDTDVSIMGSLYNAIQYVNSNIITPENTPLYNINHDNANFKYKSVKTINAASTTDVEASTDPVSVTLDALNEGETVTQLEGWNYLGWIVANNTGYYKVIDTPLHWIEEFGEKDKTYTVSDRLQGVYAQGTSLWCKDLGGDKSIVKTTPNTGQIDHLMNDAHCKREGGWDQSNWVELDFSDFGETNGKNMAAALKDHYIKAATVTGVYSDDVNYTIKLTAEPEADGEASYVPNTYITSNFIEDNLTLKAGDTGPAVTKDGTTTYYYFLNPKIQEYAIITYAMWDWTNQIMVIPNNSPFTGAACIGRWDLNEFDNQLTYLDNAAQASETCNNQYEFHIIVQRTDKSYGTPINTSKDVPSLKPGQTASAVLRTQPLDLKAESPLPTAINGVISNAQVVSIEYVNIAGMRSSTPWQGLNIMVVLYSDGTTAATKFIK